MDFLDKYRKCMNWVHANTVEGNGIAVTNKRHIIYPEVTGYFIPSLLRWGERDLALSYARFLCSIQKEDGSWYDSADRDPYVFDTAQILKGLLAARELLTDINIDDHIIRGCDWILTNLHPDGRLTTPSKNAWGKDENFCSELIHIYCLKPIQDAGAIYSRLDYSESVEKILAYYKREYKEKILNFSLLSHFYAYVMEGLVDLGEVDMAREAMNRITVNYSTKNGGIKGLKDVPWVCSTGIFQLALTWFKLGDYEKGCTMFNYACSLQNESGGWYGSYPSESIFNFIYRGKKRPFYFVNEEISWACKYFLDAFSEKERLNFERQSSIFLETISREDGRYRLIHDIVAEGSCQNVIDLGCGKGRYLKNLIEDYPNVNYYAIDISDSVMRKIDFIKDKRTGSLTNIPYQDNMFDLVYVCEAYEHAIDQRNAFSEMYRITAPGGKIVVIDKPVEKLGKLKLDEAEQWVSDDDIKAYCEFHHASLQIIESVPYQGKDDGLFRAWIVTK